MFKNTKKPLQRLNYLYLIAGIPFIANGTASMYSNYLLKTTKELEFIISLPLDFELDFDFKIYQKKKFFGFDRTINTKRMSSLFLLQLFFDDRIYKYHLLQGIWKKRGLGFEINYTGKNIFRTIIDHRLYKYHLFWIKNLKKGFGVNYTGKNIFRTTFTISNL